MARPDSAFAVILRRDRVLLVQAWFKRRWQLPGGALEANETPPKAARREVKEETGMAARIGRLTGRYLRRDGSTAFVFAARVASGTHPLGPRREIRRQRWFTPSGAMRRLSSSANCRLRDALGRMQNSAAFDSGQRSPRRPAADQFLDRARTRAATGPKALGRLGAHLIRRAAEATSRAV